MNRTAFISGICGQDGDYLSRLLLESGYQVVGTDTPDAMASVSPTASYDHATLLSVNLKDAARTEALLEEFQFSEIYNLAGISFIPASWDAPLENLEINACIPLNLLEGIRKTSPHTRIFQACSSELFGDCEETPQTESTPFHPRSPYSANKIYAYHLVNLYREYRDVFAVNGILYNHESPRRPVDFVTRKITRGVAAISLGLQEKLALGDLDAQRDWSYAGDIVRAMHLTLQHDTADNYVIGSGKLHSVRDFCRVAFQVAGLDYQDFVITDPDLHREERSTLQADPNKIHQTLDWATQTSFEDLVRMMVEADLLDLRQTQKSRP